MTVSPPNSEYPAGQAQPAAGSAGSWEHHHVDQSSANQSAPPYENSAGYPVTPPISSGPSNYTPATNVPSGQPESNAPLYVLLSLGAVAVLGVVAVVVFSLANHNNEQDAALQEPKSTASSSATSNRGNPNSDQLDLNHSDFNADWKSSRSDNKASHKDGWDYNDCSEIEDGSTLTDMGCEYATDNVFKAQDGKMLISNFYLGMTDEKAATEAKDGIKDNDFLLGADNLINDYKYGEWTIGSAENITVITVVTATKDVGDAVCDDYLEEMNLDMIDAVKDLA